MSKQILILFAVFFTLTLTAQDKTSSPYSYYGVGTPTFNGTADYRSMEGLSVDADSTRFNLENPAALGKLQLTSFTVGASQSFTTLKNIDQEEDIRNTTFDYLAVAIPAGKFSFGFGLLPKTSVGYKLEETGDDFQSRFTGRGGLSNVFLSAGYRINKNLSIGIEGGYNYGNVQNENLLFQEDIQYGTREKNRSDLNGFNFKLAAHYEVKLKKNLRLQTLVSYAPKAKLTSKNKRWLATLEQSGSSQSVISENEISLENTNFYTPANLRIGAGIGKFQKWMVGIEYQNIGKEEYTNTSFSPDNIEYKKANVYRLGGYFIPNYNDITNYFNRITFKAGLRYQETGMNINQEDIDEFGISFGLGLPAGKYMSNINLGVEYGQRGTTSAGLIKEDFINVFIGVTLNDRWFIQRRYR